MNGDAVIEVNVTSDSATAVVSWTDPTPGTLPVVGRVYNCYPSNPGDTTCFNGDPFPITYTLPDYNGRILVEYDIIESFSPVVTYDCVFYLRVLGKLHIQVSSLQTQ